MRKNPRNARRRNFGYLELVLILSFLTLSLQLLSPSIGRWWNRPKAGQQVAGSFGSDTGSTDYLIYLPVDYDGSKTPLMLFLHGSGDRGADIEQVKRGGLPAIIESGEHFPMIIVSPQCPADSRWQPGKLLGLLDHICETVSIDEQRIYVTGYSMGGFGAWDLAAAAPDRFAALASVSGGGDPATASRLSKLPIWAFHGATDTAVPLKSSQKIVDAVQSAGGNAKLTVYPNEGHGVCNTTFRNRALYTWLLEQHH